MVTIDPCYKLHGYPLGYKPKQRFPEETVKIIAVNKVFGRDQSNYKIDQDCAPAGHFLKTLNNSQYQHLVTMHSSHLVS